MQIIVKTLTGRKANFTFEPTQTVSDLIFSPHLQSLQHLFSLTKKILQVKQALQEKEGIDVNQIRLIWKGKQL